jgi:hypothetical protein
VDVPEPFPYREICSKMGILYGIGYGMSYEDDELEDEFAASDAESRSGESSLEGAEALEVSQACSTNPPPGMVRSSWTRGVAPSAGQHPRRRGRPCPDRGGRGGRTSGAASDAMRE